MEILGAQEHQLDKEMNVEGKILSLVTGEMTMRRLADVIPEAFGLILISHLKAASGVNLPTCFYAKDAMGDWQSFDFDREPIFGAAIVISQHVFHNGPRHIMKNVADRSGLLATISNALDTGASLEGSTLKGPQFFGLPASLYETPQSAMSKKF